MATEWWSEETGTIRELASQVAAEAQLLIADLLALFDKEARDRAAELRSAAVRLAAAVVALAGGGAVLLAAAVAGLAVVMPVWAAALVVALVVLIAGGLLAGSGLARLRRSFREPTETLRMLKDGTRWLTQRPGR